jgi:hypothetical protein
MVASLVVFAACADDPVGGAEPETSTSSGDGDGDGDGDPGSGDGDPSSGDGDGDSAAPAGIELLAALAGLWAGPVTMTPLGTFEAMHMDMRPVDDHALFSRVDLDASNSLRFMFSIETIAGQDQLVYRNGGYFLGMLRDTRTALVEHDASHWRFCAVDGGCEYVDANWERQSETELVLDVKVQGEQHVLWIADRVETRSVPDPFPADASPQGSGDAPFPTMPSLKVDVSWSDPLLDPADVYVLLSTQDCPLNGFCEFSRSIRGTAEAGTTSLELHIDQVHAGDYKGNAILDRDQNLETSLFPGAGDAVSLPNQAITIAATGESTASLVALVEL